MARATVASPHAVMVALLLLLLVGASLANAEAVVVPDLFSQRSTSRRSPLVLGEEVNYYAWNGTHPQPGSTHNSWSEDSTKFLVGENAGLWGFTACTGPFSHEGPLDQGVFFTVNHQPPQGYESPALGTPGMTRAANVIVEFPVTPARLCTFWVGFMFSNDYLSVGSYGMGEFKLFGEYEYELMHQARESPEFPAVDEFFPDKGDYKFSAVLMQTARLPYVHTTASGSSLVVGHVAEYEDGGDHQEALFAYAVPLRMDFYEPATFGIDSTNFEVRKDNSVFIPKTTGLWAISASISSSVRIPACFAAYLTVIEDENFEATDHALPISPKIRPSNSKKYTIARETWDEREAKFGVRSVHWVGPLKASSRLYLGVVGNRHFQGNALRSSFTAALVNASPLEELKTLQVSARASTSLGPFVHAPLWNLAVPHENSSPNAPNAWASSFSGPRFTPDSYGVWAITCTISVVPSCNCDFYGHITINSYSEYDAELSATRECGRTVFRNQIDGARGSRSMSWIGKLGPCDFVYCGYSGSEVELDFAKTSLTVSQVAVYSKLKPEQQTCTCELPNLPPDEEDGPPPK